jgi:hypothetical protein
MRRRLIMAVLVLVLMIVAPTITNAEIQHKATQYMDCYPAIYIAGPDGGRCLMDPTQSCLICTVVSSDR